MEPNRNALFMAVAIALLAGLAVGYFIGNAQGNVAIERKFMPILNAVYPPPPNELFSLTGTVKGVYGAEFELEIDDPDDYLPHLDGSPRAKQTRTANTSATTAFVLIDFEKLDEEGNPSRTALTLADVKEGDIVTVQSNENIRDAGSFEASVVQKVIY